MNTENVKDMEESLKKRFKMHRPSPEYVSRLRHKLTHMPVMEVEYPKTGPEVFVALAAIISYMVLWVLFLKKFIQK